MIAPNSYVPAGSRIPENTLWEGNPVRFVKNLDPVESRISQAESAEQIRAQIAEE